jgi:hypothetical protein
MHVNAASTNADAIEAHTCSAHLLQMQTTCGDPTIQICAPKRSAITLRTCCSPYNRSRPVALALLGRVVAGTCMLSDCTEPSLARAYASAMRAAEVAPSWMQGMSTRTLICGCLGVL